MQLEKKMIRMDRIKCQAETQIVLEEDKNLPDNKPDIEKILYENGNVILDEAKPYADHVSVKGKLVYEVLYQSEEEKKVDSFHGEIPFEEQIFLEKAEPGDNASIEILIEDLTAGIINSRKASIQAILIVRPVIEELYDVEIPINIEVAENCEVNRNTCEMTGLQILKKDVLRIREELELAKNLPNINEILWKEVCWNTLDFKPMDGEIQIKGDLNVFVLYETQQKDTEALLPVFGEWSVPINQRIECTGSTDNMLADINCLPAHQEFEIHADFDGEDRVIGVELSYDLNMRLYEETKEEILSDLYAIGKETELKADVIDLKQRPIKLPGKMKMEEKINLSDKDLTLKHMEARPYIGKQQITEKGLELSGSIKICALLEKDGQLFGYREEFPFQTVVEFDGRTKKSIRPVKYYVEQITGTIEDQKLMVRCVLNYELLAFEKGELNIITDVTIREMESEKRKKLPVLVGYVVKEDDTLWEIGKKYRVSIESMKKENNLTAKLEKGDKILIIR